MKTHSTNYTNTFIAIADDCTALQGQQPPVKENSLTAANIQFDLISQNPYKFTSDDVLFATYAQKNNITQSQYSEARAQYFSKGQPCLRASALTKRYGWGVHCNPNGKIAIFGVHSAEYNQFIANKDIKVVKAMKSQK